MRVIAYPRGRSTAGDCSRTMATTSGVSNGDKRQRFSLLEEETFNLFRIVDHGGPRLTSIVDANPHWLRICRSCEPRWANRPRRGDITTDKRSKRRQCQAGPNIKSGGFHAGVLGFRYRSPTVVTAAPSGGCGHLTLRTALAPDAHRPWATVLRIRTPQNSVQLC
jgi:hypothetical protein